MTVRPVNVIVCTRNRAHLLPKVIGQLRTQDYPVDAFEIIVVDNGSTDQTQQVVDQFINEPGVRLHYVVESRSGITFARNRGAVVASYPYLAYLDDDCSVRSDWLSQLIQGFDIHDDVAVVGGRVVLDWSQTERPAWLGPELERWLAANSHLGAQPRLLNDKEHIVEGNIALKREAWLSTGGFLGMEQFGSRNMAASEVLYMLKQIERQGLKIAFVPGAIAHHRVRLQSKQRMLERAFWQGVSDGILDYLINRRSWLSTFIRIILDAAAMIVLLGYAGFSYLKADKTKGFYHLLRVIRRFSLILSEMCMLGDWTRVRTWALANPLVK